MPPTIFSLFSVLICMLIVAASTAAAFCYLYLAAMCRRVRKAKRKVNVAAAEKFGCKSDGNMKAPA